MSSATHELRFVFLDEDPLQEEVLESVLLQNQVDLSTIVQSHDKEKHQTILSIFSNDLQYIEDLFAVLKTIRLNQIELQKHKHDVDDWQNKWKEEFKPFVLSDSFEVVPAWLKDDYHSDRTPIYIDTSIAFGTGLHETTRFMVQLIESQKNKFQSFVDIGTGTGILAITAKLLEAEKILAFDISDGAIGVAKENFIFNGIDPDQENVFVKADDIFKYAGDESYDFVAANLITQDLIDSKEKIMKLVSPGGFLAVSGISLAQEHRFWDAYQDQPLEKVFQKNGESWTAILFRKIVR